MHKEQNNDFSFNLLEEPWISLQKPDGAISNLGIKEALLRAQEFSTIFEISPLVTVGIQRLLIAIVQQILSPSTEKELKQCWQLKKLPADLVIHFAEKYADRFDLFSPDMPFYQSADVSIPPAKEEIIKSVANLVPLTPSGTESTHFYHKAQENQLFCPRCAANGLVSLPAFATSGGSGIRPSINGVPPLYVLPCGNNLLESLMFSLVLPDFQPSARSLDKDHAWWDRDPIIKKGGMVDKVGYLHSLTFMPRRVRLLPEKAESVCTLCGERTSVCIRKMVFDGGEYREKESAFWFDPFAAYHSSDGKKPIAIRPVIGKAVWREYASLFLKVPETEVTVIRKLKQDKTIRPSILDQISTLTEGEFSSFPVRCIGLRTDMKAKVFEWVDTSFEVPVSLLNDENAAFFISRGLRFSKEVASCITSVFRRSFGGNSANSERYSQVRAEMLNSFWSSMSLPFREWVLEFSAQGDKSKLFGEWIERSIAAGKTAYITASSSVGDEASKLRDRYTGEKLCNIFLADMKKKELNDDR